jgi:5-methylcytosine-specific restriction endonuclease McrA
MADPSPWHHELRKSLTDQERARLFLERGGRCHRCARKIMRGETWYDEHVLSLGNGGTNAWDNRALTCRNCFPLKNAEDAKKQAKGRAVAIAGIIPPSQRQKRHRLRKPPGTRYDWGARRYVKIEASNDQG